VAIIVYIQGFEYFGMLKGSQILSSSGVSNMGCYCTGRCGGNIPQRSAHESCHILVMDTFEQAPLILPMMQEPKSLMLC
jgi:hypothetical protein